ncbi:hypothetical protein EMCG_09020 [[Emmonsia] crescens]|uniref:Secreted protein n=1 Tax=[Emmonsia] crescens TaxID=73230 RepID=A0A0G2I407_9EURO|nr:hypothetical protein EMCG_09020 [Emmonsia crescens UAMH 3008]
MHLAVVLLLLQLPLVLSLLVLRAILLARSQHHHRKRLTMVLILSTIRSIHSIALRLHPLLQPQPHLERPRRLLLQHPTATFHLLAFPMPVLPRQKPWVPVLPQWAQLSLLELLALLQFAEA